MPAQLVKIALQSSDLVGAAVEAELSRFFEDAVAMLAKRVLTAPFGERALRHAVFARLTALHEHAAALPRNRGTADACAAAQPTDCVAVLTRRWLSRRKY